MSSRYALVVFLAQSVVQRKLVLVVPCSMEQSLGLSLQILALLEVFGTFAFQLLLVEICNKIGYLVDLLCVVSEERPQLAWLEHESVWQRGAFQVDRRKDRPW